MAVTKARRSSRSSKLATRVDRVTSTRHPQRAKAAERRTQPRSSSLTRITLSSRAQRTLKRLASSSRIVRFPQAKGRIVEEVELFIDASYNGLTLKFQDNSSLSFEFATGFAVEAYLSRWKAGNERVLRYWPRLHSEPVF